MFRLIVAYNGHKKKNFDKEFEERDIMGRFDVLRWRTKFIRSLLLNEK